MRARTDFRAVRAIDPSNPAVLRGEAIIAMKARDFDTAVARLTEALERDPDDAWSRRMRADAYWELGEHEKSFADSARIEAAKEKRGGG